MTLLAADIGNSDTVLGLLDGADVVAHWRVSTDERRTSDEWAVLVRGLVAETGLQRRAIAVCSTVPAVLHEWRDMLARHFEAIPSVVVEPGVRTGVPVLMDNPREVGADRIINALAAAHEFGGPAIVVDFGGTATTFDVVSAAGQYVGGAIAPGIELSLEALGRRGAQLRKVELQRPRSVIAKNTVEALQSGMLFGDRRPGRRHGGADDRRARCRHERGQGHLDGPSRATRARGMLVFHRAFSVVDPSRASSRLRAQFLIDIAPQFERA